MNQSLLVSPYFTHNSYLYKVKRATCHVINLLDFKTIALWDTVVHDLDAKMLFETVKNFGSMVLVAFYDQLMILNCI